MDAKAAVDVSARGAEQFVELYYKVFDAQRSRLGKLYRDTSLIIWNGNAYAGEQAYTTAMNRLPVSSHDIFSFDCHPLIAAASSPDGTAFPLLLTVNGVVKYGDDTSPRPFSQHFSLQPDPHKPGNYFVANDCFRFV